jgi:cyclophilin family peptidyl-prolyl cis-trans isomerase
VGRWYLDGGDRQTRETGLDLLSEIWEQSADDDVVAARLAVLEAASTPEIARKGPKQREILKAGLSDPDWRVRHRAARALRDVFDIDETKRVGPATDLPLAHYREIATWAQTPRAAVVTVRRPSFTPGRFTVALDTDGAPLSAWNFAMLAQDRFYDGIPIFGLDLNRALLSGDPRGDGLGGPGYSLPEENGRPTYATGLLGMTNEEGGSHGSQWFATLSNHPELDGRFTMFASVAQNVAGVLMLVEPDDLIVSIRMYEGDGTEPLPPLDR